MAVFARKLVSDGTGIEIGEAASDKIGMYGEAPVVQADAIADATDAASAITQLNLALAALKDIGIIA